MSEATYNKVTSQIPAFSWLIKPKTDMADNDPRIDICKVPLLNGLDSQQLQWLRNRLYMREFAEGVDVIVAGLPGEVVYIILSGTMKVYILQPDGTAVIVAILGPGDPVGELSLVDQASRSANVVTLEKTTVLWMNQRDFHQALFSMPALSQNLLRTLSARLRYSTGHIQSLAALDVNQRIAHQLLAFAERYGQPAVECEEQGHTDEILIPIRLTQGDIAELVGASRKRVNQAMVVFKRKGLISIDADYRITIRNRAALQDWLSQGQL